MPNVVVDKGDIIASALGVAFEAVQNSREELMRQTALCLVHEKDAQIIGAVRFQGPRCGVWHVADLPCSLAYLFFGSLTDIVVTVQRLAHGSHRDPACLCDVFDGCHGIASLHLP